MRGTTLLGRLDGLISLQFSRTVTHARFAYTMTLLLFDDSFVQLFIKRLASLLTVNPNYQS